MLTWSFLYECRMDAMDCSPACLKMIGKLFGKFYSFQPLCNLCGITHEGAALPDPGYGAEKTGLPTLVIKTDHNRHFGGAKSPIKLLLRLSDNLIYIAGKKTSQL